MVENVHSRKFFRCPTCGKRVKRDHPDRPFCSQRCRLLDLGHWLEGNYRVAGEITSQIKETEDE